EALRQVDKEPDLRRQAELLEAAIRVFPNDGSLLERLRAVRDKLDEAESTAQQARQAEAQERWDDAIALWNQVRKQYSEYPDLDAEIARVEQSKRQARAADRDRLLGQITDQLKAGDYDNAGAALQQALQQFPGDAELQQISSQVQAVRHAVRQARAMASEA